jgi:SAM-dependent methyltransferase
MTDTASRRDFTRRSREAEWLDGEGLDAAELALFLRDLAAFNRAMLGHYPILRWIGRVVRDIRPQRPLVLVDAGCGYGDLLRRVRRWADRRGIEITLLGLDSNEETIRIARDATDARERIDFAVTDAMQFRPATPIDLLVSSLLAHHLGDREIVELLRWMEATARRGWLVCDLMRHKLPYHAIGWAGKLCRLNRTVFDDGQISVLRALNRAEWSGLLGAAGIPPGGASVRSFLFRWVIARRR